MNVNESDLAVVSTRAGCFGWTTHENVFMMLTSRFRTFWIFTSHTRRTPFSGHLFDGTLACSLSPVVKVPRTFSKCLELLTWKSLQCWALKPMFSTFIWFTAWEWEFRSRTFKYQKVLLIDEWSVFGNVTLHQRFLAKEGASLKIVPRMFCRWSHGVPVEEVSKEYFSHF